MCIDVLNVDKFSMFLMNGLKTTDKDLQVVPAATRILTWLNTASAEI